MSLADLACVYNVSHDSVNVFTFISLSGTVTPPMPVPSPDEKGGGSQTAGKML